MSPGVKCPGFGMLCLSPALPDTALPFAGWRLSAIRFCSYPVNKEWEWLSGHNRFLFLMTSSLLYPVGPFFRKVVACFFHLSNSLSGRHGQHFQLGGCESVDDREAFNPSIISAHAWQPALLINSSVYSAGN